MLAPMAPRDWMSTPAMTDGQAALGARVHVGDAGLHGYTGHVTAVHRDAVTVTRDTGGRELVILSRRRVTAVHR